jgi:translation initiation factor 2 beta subunit (eIF-2beta)/eIF-5
MINIGGTEGDLYYRYKRHKTEIKKVKNCTMFLNLNIIAQELNIKTEDLSKYLQKALGLSIKGTVINGIVVTVENIEKNIEKYIKSYILCPRCSIPEWDGQTCKACGHNSKVVAEVAEVEEETASTKNIHDIKISYIMHYLYDILLDTKWQKDQVEMIEKCLEYCWHDERANDSTYKITKINKNLAKLNIPIYVPVKNSEL